MALTKEGSAQGEVHSISVVIPTLNSAKRLPALLMSLQGQTFVPNEVIVVDSESDDGTAEIAERSGARVIRIRRSVFSHGGTRAMAFREAMGDVVVFLTDDAVPADDVCLANLVAPLQGDVAMAYGRQLPRNGARRFEQLVREFNYPVQSHVTYEDDIEHMGIKAFFASDSCAAYRRDAWETCGGFPTVATNEDMLMAAKFLHAGYGVAYVADARVVHSHAFTPRQQYLRNRASAQVMTAHRDLLAGGEATGEGVRMVKEVSKTLLKERRVGEFVSFSFDCVARLAGSLAGKHLAADE